MGKIYHILRWLLGIYLLLPLLALFGVFPEPTADMYSTPEAWAFMEALMTTGYMMLLITLTSVACAILLFMNKTALAAVLLAPFSLNVILFHLFLDASIISAAAIPAYILVAINIYFLWVNKEKYKPLW